MATKVREEEDSIKDLDTSPKSKLGNLILSNMRGRVEFPSHYMKLEAVNVFGTRWRVNAWVWTEEKNACVESSWFVVADLDGNIKSFN